MPGFVFTYGRFNPPTRGHGLLFREIMRKANDLDAVPVIVVSHSNASKKNPLTADEKIEIIKLVYPDADVRASGPGNQISDIIKQLIIDYKKPGLMLLGSDRVKGMSFLKMYGINIEQAGENRTTGNSSSSLKNISGTKARAAAVKRNLNAFRFQSILGNAPNLKNRMNMLANRIATLPNKTPSKPKTARAKSVPPPIRRRGLPSPVPLLNPKNRKGRGSYSRYSKNNFYIGKELNKLKF